MANFQEHVNQAKKNLEFLAQINKTVTNCWDWQVTVSFYVGVHLVNAHIAQKTNQHYRSHEHVNKALNPHEPLSITKLTEKDYLAYTKLQGLSRRSRYLCHDENPSQNEQALFTYDRHLAKALRCLNTLLVFMQQEYGIQFDSYSLNCIDIGKQNYAYFKHSAVA